MSDEKSAELARLAMKLDPQAPYTATSQAPKKETSSDGLPSASTSHLVVVDKAGNMVSLTQSLSLHFGARVVAPGTGILLNNSLSNFATHDRAAVNHVGAGKRARSTIAPIISEVVALPSMLATARSSASPIFGEPTSLQEIDRFRNEIHPTNRSIVSRHLPDAEGPHPMWLGLPATDGGWKPQPLFGCGPVAL